MPSVATAEPPATVHRDLRFAKSWLYDQLRPE
jgi:hypothetical protein